MYGLAILPENDPLVKTTEEALDGLLHAGVPGRFLVDIIPLCENMCLGFTYS